MGSSGPITIRPAGEDDVPLLTRLLRAFQDDARRFDGDLDHGRALGTAAVVAAMLEGCRQRRGAVLIAELDGQPAGFASCALEAEDISLKPGRRKSLEIDDLFVLPGARRRGVARRLIEAAAEHGRAMGAIRLTAVAYAGNQAALEAYRAAGFEGHQVRLLRRL